MLNPVKYFSGKRRKFMRRKRENCCSEKILSRSRRNMRSSVDALGCLLAIKSITLNCFSNKLLPEIVENNKLANHSTKDGKYFYFFLLILIWSLSRHVLIHLSILHLRTDLDKFVMPREREHAKHDNMNENINK